MVEVKQIGCKILVYVIEHNIAKIIWGGHHDIMLTKQNIIKPNHLYYDNYVIKIERVREDEPTD